MFRETGQSAKSINSINLLIAGTTLIVRNTADGNGGGVAIELQRSQPLIDKFNE
jgi:hypothetical protein